MKENIKIGIYDNSMDLRIDLVNAFDNDVFIVCVGTDRSTGDSLAPLIGTFLQEKGYTNVIGTIDDPVHGMNIEERIKEIPEGVKVLAIDACLGKHDNIGKFELKKGALKAGQALGKDLPEVGDYHINGIVNINSHEPMINYQVLQNTRLSVTLEMSRKILSAIELAFPLERNLCIAEEIVDYK